MGRYLREKPRSPARSSPLGAQAKALIIDLIPSADRVADSLAHELCERQFKLPPTLEFFSTRAEKTGIPLAELRRHLERAQAGYLRGVFQGA